VRLLGPPEQAVSFTPARLAFAAFAADNVTRVFEMVVAANTTGCLGITSSFLGTGLIEKLRKLVSHIHSRTSIEGDLYRFWKRSSRGAILVLQKILIVIYHLPNKNLNLDEIVASGYVKRAMDSVYLYGKHRGRS